MITIGSTLFFSWKNIYKYYNKNPAKIMDFFTEINSSKKLPDNFVGNSYLLNLNGLIESSYYNHEKIEYIALASIRNFFDYEYLNKKGLYLYFSPINKEKLKNNRLLTITNDYIKFKLEEI